MRKRCTVLFFLNRTKKVQKTRRVEMKGMISAICVVLCVVGSAFGAGGPISEDRGNQLSGYFSLSTGMPQWNSYSYEADGSVRGSFNILLDPALYSFESASWSFYTNWYDTSYWTARCYVRGLREVSEDCPQSQNWHQSVSEDGLDINAGLNFNCYEYPNYGGGLGVASGPSSSDDAKTQTMSVDGYFNINPSDLFGSDLMYMEGTEDHWVYPDGYENPPVITSTPTWTAQYTMYGRFIAPTIEEARAMGAEYAEPVPEPSTFVLMAIGLLTSLAAYLRRK